MNLKQGVLLLALVILVGVPESFARPQYLTSLTTVYGDGSCGTCHVITSGGGERNSYGTLFENQPNYNNDPIAALEVIGSPSAATTPPAPEITEEIPGVGDILEENQTQEEIGTEEDNQTQEEIGTEEGNQTQEESETPAETAASPVTTIRASRTQTTPGFGIVAAIVGLFAWAFLARRKYK